MFRMFVFVKSENNLNTMLYFVGHGEAMANNDKEVGVEAVVSKSTTLQNQWHRPILDQGNGPVCMFELEYEL